MNHATSTSPAKAVPSAFRRLPLAALIVAALGGCAVLPEPLTDAQRQTRIDSDMTTLFKDMEPVTGPISLHEAFARALKYNYDYRLRMMESALSNAQLDLSHYDMLPKLTTSAGYASRNNDAGSRSVNLITGEESNLFSGAQDRNRNTASAAFTWNILDFGVSYVRAQQQATQSLIVEEHKRKVAQNISQDVRQAFWRAYGAQKALPRLDDLLNRVNEAVARSRRMEEQRLLPPLQALAYQRAMLDLQQQIVTRRQELVLAKTELAALINLRPGTEMVLTGGNEEAEAASLRPLDNLEALDQAALANRPEAREEDYRKKVTVLEARRALLSMLPGIDINLSTNYDNNRFLFNNHWSEAGGTISLNLLRVLSYPSMKRAQEAQEKFDDARRLALSMAVLTQVRIAVQRYHEAMADYEVNRHGAEVDARIEKNMLAGTKASAESQMELLRVEVKSALSEMQRYVSFANLQMSYARVANSVGADLLPDAPQGDDLGVFTRQLAQADGEWRKTSFHTVAGEAPAPSVFVASLPMPAGVKADLVAMLRDRLPSHGATVVPLGAAGVADVTAEIRLGESRVGLRSIEVVWTVRRDNVLIGIVPYRSVIAENVETSWPIFGEAAAEAAAHKISGMLRANAAKSASAHR